MGWPVIFIGFMLTIAFGNAFAGDGKYTRRVYDTVRVDSLQPVIDGKLDDPFWQCGVWGTDFVQWAPDEGAKPSQKTEFKILYDERYIYGAMRFYDTEPEKISRILSRKDEYTGDGGGFGFDSYYDRRTAYEFSLSAAGTKYDLTHLDDGKSWSWDVSWNAVWDGKAALEDSAWTLEIKVPFTQLRFNDLEEQIWGLHVWRYIYRNSEESFWQLVPRYGQGGVHYFADLRGIKGIKPHRQIEILPYMRTKGETFRKELGNPFADGRSGNAAFGLDGKIGLGGNFVLDLTTNPDFGQVEADPSIINLTSFETFYDEKRPFFLEGKQSIMNFPIKGDLLYYSRRIGKAPGYIPPLGESEYIKMPGNTTILNALKITGKTENGTSIGVMQSLASGEEARIHSEEGSRSESVEPLSSYFVGRVEKSFRNGGTLAGGIITATNRKIESESLRFLHDGAYSGGLNFSHKWGNMSYYLDMNTVFSHVRGDAEALRFTQESSRHYFQRPDAGYLDYDPARTSLSGHGGTFEIGKGGTGRWRIAENVTWYSPGLDFNDIGYMRTADLAVQNTRIGYVVNKPFGIVRDFAVYANQYNHWNFGGEQLVRGGNLQANVQFVNQYGFSSEIERNSERLDMHLLRGGPSLFTDGKWNHKYEVYTNRRKNLNFSLEGENEWYDEGASRFYRVEPGYLLRLSNAFNIRNTFSYARNKDDVQYVEEISMDNGRRYILAKIGQKTFSTTFRITYCITPELTMQYYGQPFISAGSFSGFKRVTQPRAERYSARFHRFGSDELGFSAGENVYDVDENTDGAADYSFRNPDFNVRQFRSNLVVRWEYSPGSTVYLVWSQERNGEYGERGFRVRDNIRRLFDIYPHNVFLVKWSHWFTV